MLHKDYKRTMLSVMQASTLRQTLMHPRMGHVSENDSASITVQRIIFKDRSTTVAGFSTGHEDQDPHFQP